MVVFVRFKLKSPGSLELVVFLFCVVPQRGHSFAWRVKRSFRCKGHTDVAEAASKQDLIRAQSSSQRSEKKDNSLVCLVHSNLYQI